MAKRKYILGAGGVGLLALAVAFVSCQDATPRAQTIVGADGTEQPVPPGTVVNNFNYPEGEAPPNQQLALSADQAIAAYSTQLLLSNEAARGAFEQGLICTAAGISFEAQQQATQSGQPVERVLAAKLQIANQRMSKGWELLERVSFQAGDRDKFFGPAVDILALQMAMDWAAKGTGIPAGCEVIPETVTGPVAQVIDTTGSMLRLKTQIPVMTQPAEIVQAPVEVPQEVDADAGQTE